MSEPTLEDVIRTAGRIVYGAAFDAIDMDGHTWSSRPCATCRVVSATIGRPFGCSRLAIERAARGAAPL